MTCSVTCTRAAIGRVIRRAMKKEIARQVSLATRETDDTFVLGARRAAGGDWRDRWDYQRDEILRDALLAWRDNPLARRIVELTTQYVVGGGIKPQSKHTGTNKFLKEFWEHRLNHMDIRVMEWCDEMTRSANLFVLITTDSSGMSFVRAVAAADIQKIDHKKNDVEQPTRFWPLATTENPDPEPWPAYDEETDARDEKGEFPTVMLHFAINRPVGAQWGESDLTPVLRWLSRYNGWLEDRARLNRFRNVFIWDVTTKGLNADQRAARQAEINANPPTSGTALLHDETEIWETKLPRLESQDIAADGLALKKMIAAGAGIPMHFLAEPEGSTRTTAEASGGPTYRHYEQRQIYFLWMLRDLLGVVRRRAGMAARSGVSLRADIEARGPDISARDNAALATAAAAIVAFLIQLRDRQLIDDAELLRLAYYFAGEVVDVDEMLARAKAAPPPVGAGVSPPQPKDDQPANGAEEPEDETALTAAPPVVRHAAQQSGAEEDMRFNIIVQVPPAQYIPPAAVIVNPQPAEVRNDVGAGLAPALTAALSDALVLALAGRQPDNIIVNVPQQVMPDVIIDNKLTLDDDKIVVNIAAPAVAVKVDAPNVNITNEVKLPTVVETAVVEYNDEGRAAKITKTYEQEPDAT